MREIPILGAGGLDSNDSKFLIDPNRSVIAENYHVRSKSRKMRQQYSRVLFEKYYSNAVRLRERAKNFIIAKDSTNTTYNIFNGDGTVEFRFKLHGVDGFSLQDLIPILSREVYSSAGSGVVGYFEVTLKAVDSPTEEEYYIQLKLSSPAGTITVPSVTTKIVYDIWYHIAISYNTSTGDVIFYKDGVSETISSTAARPAGTGHFINTASEGNNCDLLIGTDENYLGSSAIFANIDIDEIRLWADVRTPTEIALYDDIELPASEISDSNLACYINFQADNIDDFIFTDLANSANSVFICNQGPQVDSNNYLCFNGTTQYGGLSSPTVGSGHTVFDGTGTSEIRLIPLKPKQGFIAGNLEIYPASTKWGFKYHYLDDATPSSISTGDLIDTSDFGVTFYTVSFVFDAVPNTVSLYIDGVLSDTATVFGIHVVISGSTGRNIGTNPGATVFSSMRLEFLRYTGQKKEAPNLLEYFNSDVPKVDIDTYRHGLINSIYDNSNSQIDITGTDTLWRAKLAGSNIALDIPNDNQTDHEYTDGVIIGSATALGTANDKTGNWAVDSDKLHSDQGYVLSHQGIRYNDESFKNIKISPLSGRRIVINNVITFGDYDAAGHKNLRIDLFFKVDNAARNRDLLLIKTSGTTKLDSLNKVRFLEHFKVADAGIDVIICIVGTGIYSIDRATQVATSFPVNIESNGNKLFTSAVVSNRIYITDGKTKLVVFDFDKTLYIHTWGIKNPLKRCTVAKFTSSGSNPWSDQNQYAYAYWDSKLDQYSNMVPLDADDAGPEVASGTRAATTITNIEDALDPNSGADHIIILATAMIDTTTPDTFDWRIIDRIDSRSQGCMDWRQTSATLGLTRWPNDLLPGFDTSPPDGEIVISHRERLWILKDSKIYYSRVDGRLHSAVTNETFTFVPNQEFFEVPSNKELTAGISLNNTLFLSTCEEWFVITGFDLSDWRLLGMYKGRACVSHLTLQKYGNSFMWLGQDDIYTLSSGTPEPLDQTGKIKQFLEDNLDKTKLKEAFGIVNSKKDIYELHFIDKTGERVTIYWDLVSREFTIGTDIQASYGTIVFEDCSAVPYFGHEKGFIFKESSSGMNFQPPSGTLSGTMTSFSSSVVTDTGAAFYTTKSGLIGNTIYIVQKTGSTPGNVLRGRITANTATTITYESETVVFGVTFTPVNTDAYFIGSIFWHMKTGYFASGSMNSDEQRSRISQGLELSNPLSTQELIHIEIVRKASGSSGSSYLAITKEGKTQLAPKEITDLSLVTSKVDFKDDSSFRFLDIEIFHLQETSEINEAGYILGLQPTEGALTE